MKLIKIRERNKSTNHKFTINLGIWIKDKVSILPHCEPSCIYIQHFGLDRYPDPPGLLIPITLTWNLHIRSRTDAPPLFGKIDPDMPWSFQQLYCHQTHYPSPTPTHLHLPAITDVFDKKGPSHQYRDHHWSWGLRISVASFGKETKCPVWEIRLVDDNRLSALQMADGLWFNECVEFPVSP